MMLFISAWACGGDAPTCFDAEAVAGGNLGEKSVSVTIGVCGCDEPATGQPGDTCKFSDDLRRGVRGRLGSVARNPSETVDFS